MSFRPMISPLYSVGAWPRTLTSNGDGKNGIVTLNVWAAKDRSMGSLSGGRTRSFPYIECVFRNSRAPPAADHS